MSAECKCGFDHWPLPCKDEKPPNERAASSFAAPAGSLAHVHFEITTAAGNRAVIKGDPEMPEATRNALAQMIDALAKSVERGDFKKPENAELRHSADSAASQPKKTNDEH